MAQIGNRDASWRPKTGPSAEPGASGTPTPGAAETTAIADVLAFEKATEAAVVRGDTAALERALAPTFLFTHGDGWVDGGPPLKVDTKASWIEYVKKQPAPYIYRELDQRTGRVARRRGDHRGTLLLPAAVQRLRRIIRRCGSSAYTPSATASGSSSRIAP